MTHTVEIVKDVSDKYAGEAVLVLVDGEDYYAISSVDSAFDTGRPETLAFPASEDGTAITFSDVAGGVEKTREDVIRQLEENGPADEPHFYTDPLAPSPIESLLAMLSLIGADTDSTEYAEDDE